MKWNTKKADLRSDIVAHVALQSRGTLMRILSRGAQKRVLYLFMQVRLRLCVYEWLGVCCAVLSMS